MHNIINKQGLTLNCKKDKFRQKCKKILQNIYINSYLLDKKWFNIIKKELKKHKNILLFLPLTIEPNSKPLINWARRIGKKIFVPRIVNRSFKMVPYRLPLQLGQFNVKTCGKSLKLINKIDLAVVPTLGIDETFRRIGFGKGFYDRFFASLSYRPKIIFTQRKLCFCKQIITEDHDVKADYIATAQGLFYKGNVKRVDRINNHRHSYGGSRFFGGKENGRLQIRHICRASKIAS